MKQSTSLKALLHQIESGAIKSHCALILNEIIGSNNGLNKDQLRVILKIKDENITSRLSDLQDIGIIQVANKEKDERLQVYIHQPDQNEQVQNAIKRKYDKYIKWKKRGEKEFEYYIKKESKGDSISQIEFNF